VQGAGCRVQVLGFDVYMFRVQGSGFGARSSGIKVWGSGFRVKRVEGLESRLWVKSLGFRV
jgi:hypothetical protein